MTVERHAVTDRASWLDLRAKDITASSLGALAGVDQFNSHFDVWAEKMGLSWTEENDAMVRGRWLEPAVPCAMLDSYPGRFEIEYPLGLYVRDPELRLGGTPDARGCDRGVPVVFEFKVISQDSYEAGWTDGGAPLSYQLQTLANTMLLDAHHGILAALVMGWQKTTLEIREIPRMAGAEARIRELVRNFWTAFDEGHAPDPDYTRDAEAVRRAFRPNPDKPAPIDLTSENMLPELLDEREQLKDSIKVSDKRVQEIDTEIRHKLNGAMSAVLPGWKITNNLIHYEESIRKAYDQARLTVTRIKEKQS